MSKFACLYNASGHRAVLVTAAVVIAALLAHEAPDWWRTYGFLEAFVLISIWMVPIAAFLYIACRTSARLVTRTLVEMIAAACALLLFELTITYAVPDARDYRERRERAAVELGLPVDSRNITQVVHDLRQAGVTAFPDIARTWPQLPQVRKHLPTGFYPLSHASNVEVVKCNESGVYRHYRTDDFGFNNPPEVLREGRVDVAVVGESFALGHCVPESQGLVGRLRERYPRTASFAMVETYPLAELASFREYVEPLRPRLVLWTLNLGYIDTSNELADPLLSRYLDPTFSQHLRDRQPEIDQFIRRLALPIQLEADVQAAQRRAARWKNVWRLSLTRARLASAMGLHTPAQRPVDLTGLIRSVRLAQASATRWGGQIVVVLVPTYNDVVKSTADAARRRARVAGEIEKLGIPLIDGIELFREQEDAAGLYTLRINNHPNVRGYGLLADEVLADLAQRLPARLAVMPTGRSDDGS